MTQNPMSSTMRAHIPGGPARPGEPNWPGDPRWPGGPGRPGSPVPPGWPATPPMEVPVSPTRVWMEPHAEWANHLYDRLLQRRIVLATGILDDDAAARLSAQLLTLDAEGDGPVRLELQNLRAELTAALTVMGILDVMRAPVHACVSGEISGPALGVLISCPRRSAYPNASFVVTEPKLTFGGTVTALSAHEEHITRMLDTLYFRLAEVTGREVDDIRDDARRGRSMTTAQAIGYGLIQTQETSARAADLNPVGEADPAGGQNPVGGHEPADPPEPSGQS